MEFAKGLQPALYKALRAEFDPSYKEPIPAVAADAPLPATKPDGGNPQEPRAPPFFYNFPVVGEGVAVGLATANPGTPGAGPCSEHQHKDTGVDSPGKKAQVLKRCARRDDD